MTNSATSKHVFDHDPIMGNRFVPAPSIIQTMCLNQAVGGRGKIDWLEAACLATTTDSIEA